LLAKALAHSKSSWQTHRFREQARLLQGFVVCQGFCIRRSTLWERACPRRRHHIQNHRGRHTAFASKLSSYNDLWCARDFVYDAKPCRSRACSRRRHHIQNYRGRHTAFASRLSSYNDLWCARDFVYDAKPCRSRACSRRRHHIQNHRGRRTAFASKLGAYKESCVRA
jgi:hypothetical protein